MADVLVTCINKLPRDDTHDGITHLGGPGAGNGWKWTRQQVIESIDTGTNTFYTEVNGKRANVGVYRDGDRAWLQTFADSKWNNNLLALKECGVVFA